MLENACFSFGNDTIPQIMQRKGWDCPEKVELNVAVRVILKNQSNLDTKKLNTTLAEFLTLTMRIRHTAVHRVRVTAARVEQFLVAGERLADLVGDDNCTREMARFRAETIFAIEEFTRNKTFLVSEHKKKLDSIAAQRAELDRLELAAVADLLKDDQEYQALAGSSLEAALADKNMVEQDLVEG